MYTLTNETNKMTNEHNIRTVSSFISHYLYQANKHLTYFSFGLFIFLSISCHQDTDYISKINIEFSVLNL